MSQKECPSCALEVAQDADECPYCQYEFPDDPGNISYFIILLMIGLLLLWMLF